MLSKIRKKMFYASIALISRSLIRFNCTMNSWDLPNMINVFLLMFRKFKPLFRKDRQTIALLERVAEGW